MRALALALLLLAPAARAADGLYVPDARRAETARPRRDWSLTGEYLYYLPLNAGSGLSDQLGALGDGLVAAGYDSADKSVHTTGGSGARFTALRKWDEHTELGFSLDYVLGPTMNSDFHAFSVTFGNGGLTINRAATFVRLMAQARILLLGKTVRRPGDWSLDVGSGFGPGLGHISQTCQASGSLTCPGIATSATWAGIAWEVGPRVSVRVRDIDVGFGVVEASFPRYKGSADIASLAWQTTGFAFSAEF